MSLQTFFDNFALLADAPNAVPKLRELILQLGVEGKLVSQRPDDGSAKELLKEIKTQKARILSGSQRHKTSLSISSTDIPFVLPTDWEWARLGEVVTMTTGFAFKSPDYSQEGTLFCG
jgi:type I restriction enzyme S subunit